MDGAVLWGLNIERKLRKWQPEVAQEVKWGSEGSDWMSESSSCSFHPVAPLWLLDQRLGASAYSRTRVWGSWLDTSCFFFFFFFNHFTYLGLPNHVGSALSGLSSFVPFDGWNKSKWKVGSSCLRIVIFELYIPVSLRMLISCFVLILVVQSLSRVQLLATPWTAACQSPLPFSVSRACSNSCPLSGWCHPTISSSVVPFSCPRSFPASGSFQISQLFASGGQSTGVSASASVLPVSSQGWFWFFPDLNRSV